MWHYLSSNTWSLILIRYNIRIHNETLNARRHLNYILKKEIDSLSITNPKHMTESSVLGNQNEPSMGLRSKSRRQYDTLVVNPTKSISALV